MAFRRVLIFLCTCAMALAFLVTSAAARGSSSRSNRGGDSRGGRYRLIEDDDDKREKERKKEGEEQRKKKKEEAKKRAEEREAKKKAREEKKKAAKQKPKRTAEKPKAPKKPDKSAAPRKKTKDAEAEATKLCEEAEAAFEKGELLPGVKLLRQVMAEHEGTDAAKQAEDRLGQLLGDERLGPMILLGEAEELFAAQRYRRAFYKYNKLLASFPGGEQAADAGKRLAEIRDGDLLSKTVYTDEELADARFWLLVGNIHLENDRHGEASAAYRKVVEDYPGCPYARQAGEKLAAIPSS